MTPDRIRNYTDGFLTFLVATKPHALRLWFGGGFPWVHTHDPLCFACILERELKRRREQAAPQPKETP
jgi:hypothetical protein